MFTLFNQGFMGDEYIKYEFDDNYQIIDAYHTYPKEELRLVKIKKLVKTLYASYFARKDDITFDFLKKNHSLLCILDLEKTVRCSYLNADLFTQDELNELITLQQTLSSLPTESTFVLESVKKSNIESEDSIQKQQTLMEMMLKPFSPIPMIIFSDGEDKE